MHSSYDITGCSHSYLIPLGFFFFFLQTHILLVIHFFQLIDLQSPKDTAGRLGHFSCQEILSLN